MVFIPTDDSNSRPGPVRPGPSTVIIPPGAQITVLPGGKTTGSSGSSSSSTNTGYTSYDDWRKQSTRYDNTLPISYRPPVNTSLTADRQEQAVAKLPTWYKPQTVGDALNLLNDPTARPWIEAAAQKYYGSAYQPSWLAGWWGDRINEANAYGSRPLWMVINDILGGNGSSSDGSSGGGGGSYGGGGGGGGGSVVLTDPTSARGLLMQTMQGILGRVPTEDEYKQFVKTLSKEEMRNPRTVSASGDTAVQSGGIDPGMVAKNYVEGLPEFDSAAGQNAMMAFMRVLGA